ESIHCLDLHVLETTDIALRAVISPLPQMDFADFTDVYNHHYSALTEMVDRINAAISRAVYAGDLSFEATEGEIDDKGDDKTADRPKVPTDEQLIEVVPASALNRLKTVEFLPISMLDRILRSPDAMRSLSARDFERFIATLIDKLGFENVVITR